MFIQDKLIFPSIDTTPRRINTIKSPKNNDLGAEPPENRTV